MDWNWHRHRVAVIVISIIFVISSLPYEMLNKSPSIHTSKNPKEETSVEPAEQIQPENDSQGKAIEIKIRDGVGSRDKQS